jgi:hypothetical protein
MTRDYISASSLLNTSHEALDPRHGQIVKRREFLKRRIDSPLDLWKRQEATVEHSQSTPSALSGEANT